MVMHGFSLSQHSDITCESNTHSSIQKRHIHDGKSIPSQLPVLLLVCPSNRASCLRVIAIGLGCPVHDSRKQLTASIRHQTKKCDSVSHSLGPSPLGRADQDAHRSEILVVRPAVDAKPKLGNDNQGLLG